MDFTERITHPCLNKWKFFSHPMVNMPKRSSDCTRKITEQANPLIAEFRLFNEAL